MKPDCGLGFLIHISDVQENYRKRKPPNLLRKLLKMKSRFLSFKSFIRRLDKRLFKIIIQNSKTRKSSVKNFLGKEKVF
tara:strand:- start:459 stop:695 length:237 start_codon:yes stop_codon:yes gene_type:complete